MTYTKLPDEHLTDPKIVGLSDLGHRLYVNALVYSNLRLTDGYLPDSVLRMCLPKATARAIERAVAELQDASLWAWKPPSGYYILDFTKHQLTKEQLEGRREQKRKGGKARWGLDSIRTADAQADAERMLSTSSAEEGADAKPVPRTPYPVPVTRKERGTPFAYANDGDDRGNGHPSRIDAALTRVRHA